MQAECTHTAVRAIACASMGLTVFFVFVFSLFLLHCQAYYYASLLPAVANVTLMRPRFVAALMATG